MIDRARGDVLVVGHCGRRLVNPLFTHERRAAEHDAEVRVDREGDPLAPLLTLSNSAVLLASRR